MTGFPCWAPAAGIQGRAWGEVEENNQLSPACKAVLERYLDLNPDKPKEYRSRLANFITNDLKYRRGMTSEDFCRPWREQGEACAICRKPRVGREPFDIDHDKGNNVIRGVLCKACNFGIGKLNHDPLMLERAAQYLREPPAKPLGMTFGTKPVWKPPKKPTDAQLARIESRVRQGDPRREIEGDEHVSPGTVARLLRSGKIILP